MTIALAAACAALIILILVGYTREKALLAAAAAERREAAAERSELLNRIQRPELLPTRPVSDFVAPVREPDEWNKVGTIDLSENGDDGAV